MKNETAIYYLKKISQNCFLTSQDDQMLVDLYSNTPADIRDNILRNIAKLSEENDVAIRGAIRNKIRQG